MDFGDPIPRHLGRETFLETERVPGLSMGTLSPAGEYRTGRKLEVE